MNHNKQEWDQSPGGGAGARSPFDDARQESRQDSYSSTSHSNYQSPHQQSPIQHQQRQHSSFSHQDDDDEVYPVGRPLSYFPTHHEPLSQQEYDDEAQRSQYHQMSPMEHASSPLSSRSAEWSGGGYSGYQHPQADIPLYNVGVTTEEHNQHRSNSLTGAGVGNSQGYLDTNPHNKHEAEQQPYQYPPPQSPQPLQQLQPIVDENGVPLPKALLDPKVQKQLNKRKVYKPWFIWLVSAIQIAMLVFEFVRGYQRTHQIIQTNPFNPMIGPGTGTIISLGARFIPCMRSTYLDNITNIQCPDNSTQFCTISDICGFTPISSTGKPPNQWFRFITPIFLHGGIVHILFNMMFQMRTGADLEREMGWWRIGIIYMTSGILGFVFGGNFAQLLSPSMGASGSIFGLIGCLVLDLIQNWRLVVRPCWELSKLTLMIVVSFAFGLLPFLDNFAHIGGFIGGILTGLVFLPVVYFSKRDKYIKLGLRFIALPMIVLVLVLLITNFYKGNNTCSWCKYLSCLPINGWCDAFDQSKPPAS
ncbi:hypothetical protein CPC16_000447 [Podila verticillata]|nr:hypothetical protein CPC16_000447 [Podila verticillata]KAI9241181.1 MAG: rhomboid family-domain-containing protein [Podila humilis]